MEYFCNFIWEKGLREKNEDSLCIRQITKNGKNYLLAVVCDGIGGLSEGENASCYVVNSMLENLKRLLKKDGKLSAHKIRNSFLRKIYQCHKLLLSYGEKKQIALGTTISMLFLAERQAYLFHIGDSAVFYGKSKLKLRTKLQHTESGVLLQAIGIGKKLKPQVKVFRFRKGCVFLLASDGFYRKCKSQICSKEWIKHVTRDEKAIGILLADTKDKVQEMGERDNISAICIRT